jgi:hypothetical protein
VIALADQVYHQTTLGYQAIFTLAALFLALGAVFVSFIRSEQPMRAGAHQRAPGAGWGLAAGSHGGQARGFLRFWPIWERVTRTAKPVTPIPEAPHGLLGAHVGRYRGRAITLPDGTRIARGAVIIELHFDNQRLSEVARTAGPWRLIHMIAADMGALAEWAMQSDELAQAQALMGVTLIGRASPRLGFTVRERPLTLHARLERFFMEGLMALYNPEGVRRLRRGTTYATYPVEVWMSRKELLRRYGHASREARESTRGAASQPTA